MGGGLVWFVRVGWFGWFCLCLSVRVGGFVCLCLSVKVG